MHFDGAGQSALVLHDIAQQTAQPAVESWRPSPQGYGPINDGAQSFVQVHAYPTGQPSSAGASSEHAAAAVVIASAQPAKYRPHVGITCEATTRARHLRTTNASSAKSIGTVS